MNIALPHRAPPAGFRNLLENGDPPPALSAIPFHLSHESSLRMRVVIKVGTSLIAPGGQIDADLLRAMVDQFDLSQNEYLIVTSGAIAAGMSGLALRKRPSGVPAMQACAAVGQSKLMHTYERLFFGKKVVAQLLLSSDDFYFAGPLPQFAECFGGVACSGSRPDSE